MTRLERLSRIVDGVECAGAIYKTVGPNADKAAMELAPWALAMLREAEELLPLHACPNRTAPGSLCPWCRWAAKLREEA